MHLHRGELGEDVGHLLEPRPVELQVLARGEVAVAAVVLARDVAPACAAAARTAARRGWRCAASAHSAGCRGRSAAAAGGTRPRTACRRGSGASGRGTARRARRPGAGRSRRRGTWRCSDATAASLILSKTNVLGCYDSIDHIGIMKLQQLRCLTEVARRGLNVSEAAEALHTSQPGRLQADPRPGGRARACRSSCATASAWSRSPSPARRWSRSPSACWPRPQNLKRAGEEFANDQLGTPHHRRHPHPGALRPAQGGGRVQAALSRRCELRHPPGQPDADLRAGARRRGRPRRRDRDDRRVLRSWSRCRCYQWNRCVVVPPKHPLLKETPLTLEALAEHPIVTYDFAFANRSLVQKAFESARPQAARGADARRTPT